MLVAPIASAHDEADCIFRIREPRTFSCHSTPRGGVVAWMPRTKSLVRQRIRKPRRLIDPATPAPWSCWTLSPRTMCISPSGSCRRHRGVSGNVDPHGSQLGSRGEESLGASPLRGAGPLRCASSHRLCRRLDPHGLSSLTQHSQAGVAGGCVDSGPIPCPGIAGLDSFLHAARERGPLGELAGVPFSALRCVPCTPARSPRSPAMPDAGPLNAMV